MLICAKQAAGSQIRMQTPARRPRAWSIAAAGAALLIGAGRDALAAPVLYAVATNSAFGTIDVATGTFTMTGTVSGLTSGELGDLARLPGGPLYAMTSSSALAIVNPATAATTVVGSSGNSIFAIKFRGDGVLFGASNTDLYTIDTTTGAATHVGSFGTPTSTYWDLSFDDAANLFLTRSTGTLYSVNVATGAATSIGSIGYSAVATDFDDGTLYGFTTDDQVISIDTTTGAGTLVAAETPAGTEIFAAATAAPGDDDAGAAQDGSLDATAEIDATASAVDASAADAAETETSQTDASSSSGGQATRADAGAGSTGGGGGGCGCAVAPSASAARWSSGSAALLAAAFALRRTRKHRARKGTASARADPRD